MFCLESGPRSELEPQHCDRSIMDFLIELGLFSGKILIVVIAIAVVLLLFFGLLAKARQSKPLLSVENLNEKFEIMAKSLQASIFDAKALKAEKKLQNKKRKAEKKSPADKKRLFVL